MKWQSRIGMLLLGLTLIGSLTGCRYLTNRYYDFRDTVDLGVGVTAENAVTGIVPPSLGLHAQVTDFVQLGWITHNGYTAETDMRSSYVGPDSYTKAGFLWWSYYRHVQDYDQNALYYNAFKDGDFLWCTRMESYLMSWHGDPAKRLHYEHYAPYPIEGAALLHQGWQYWGYSGVNVAICEPFLTHLGVMARVGIDPSEISDFLLGWFGLDFKHDDMLPEEYAAFRKWKRGEKVQTPMVAAPQPTPAPAPTPAPTPAPVEPQPPAGTQPAEPMRNEQTAQQAALKTIYFDFDRSNIRNDQIPRVDENLQYLLAHKDSKVLVIGNTDERGTTQYNYNLGLRRANSVRDYLVKGGVEADRIRVQSKGEENPADPGHTEEAYAKNRRVETEQLVVIQASGDDKP